MHGGLNNSIQFDKYKAENMHLVTNKTIINYHTKHFYVDSNSIELILLMCSICFILWN